MSDSCPTCGNDFALVPDPDSRDGAQSARTEYRCVCGKVTYCQECRDEQDRCAVCRALLCDADGGHDLDGERLCRQHMPVPQLAYCEAKWHSTPYEAFVIALGKRAEAA
jgi:hypothetical protein